MNKLIGSKMHNESQHQLDDYQNINQMTGTRVLSIQDAAVDPSPSSEQLTEEVINTSPCTYTASQRLWTSF